MVRKSGHVRERENFYAYKRPIKVFGKRCVAFHQITLRSQSEMVFNAARIYSYIAGRATFEDQTLSKDSVPNCPHLPKNRVHLMYLNFCQDRSKQYLLSRASTLEWSAIFKRVVLTN